MLFKALSWALFCGLGLAAWPDTPFTTNGRDIISASGAKVVYAGVNWPGAADTMLPEGLQYSSIANVVSNIKSLGMNVIRLTYSIEMIDDYLGSSPDQTLSATLIKALGSQNGNTVLQEILRNNPQFTADTTRLEVFDAVAAECANQQIWVHLDNHVSKAQWCCSETDGNAWFGDTNFPVYQWQRGLAFMASRAKSWPALSSMSLRNELRQPPADSPAQPYNRDSWYKNMVPAATGLHANNSAPLIFFSGLNYDTDDSVIATGQDLGGETFTISSLPFANKAVFELHLYDYGDTDCNAVTAGLYSAGYGAMNASDAGFQHAPVVLTEFGYSQLDGSSGSVYAQCLKSFLPSLPGGPGGWMQWVMSGSYYIRTGTQDQDETYGLLDHTWSGFRNQSVIDSYVKPFVQATLG